MRLAAATLLLVSFSRAPAFAQAAPYEPRAKDLLKNVLHDQKAIWTSPLRVNRKNAKWWILFGGAAAALIASDRQTSSALPNTKDQLAVSHDISRAGEVYSLLPAAGAFYLSGLIFHNGKARKTGLLSGEAMLDSLVVVEVLKSVTRRKRPGDGGTGRFFEGGASFPSGHSIATWALASVVAREYGNHRFVPLLAYTIASAISISRFTGRNHFASDVLAGGAMGWFIGRYVSRERRGGKASPLRPHVGAEVLPGARMVALSLRWNP